MPFWAQIVIISFTAFFTAVIVTVIFLYALLFPFLNKLFSLKLPTFDFSSMKKDEPEPVNDARTQTVLKRTQTTNPQARYMNLHKDVPTVRLPPTDKTQKEQTLTAGKIDAAVRSTKMAANDTDAKKDVKAEAVKVQPKAAAPVPRPAEPDKPDKKQKDVATVALPAAPAAAPAPSVKADLLKAGSVKAERNSAHIASGPLKAEKNKKSDVATVELPIVSAHVAEPAKTENVKPAAATPVKTESVKPAAATPAKGESVKPAAATPAKGESVKPAAATPAKVENIKPAAATPAKTENIKPAAERLAVKQKKNAEEKDAKRS